MTDVVPTCRYDHGFLVCSKGKDGASTEFYVPSAQDKLVDASWGYGFQIWQCLKCSYIELHDAEKRRSSR